MLRTVSCSRGINIFTIENKKYYLFSLITISFVLVPMTKYKPNELNIKQSDIDQN